MKNNDLVIVEGSDADALQTAANCMEEYLKLDVWTAYSYDVLSYLASETIKRIERGTSHRIKNSDIQAAVARSDSKEASAWLSPIWKTLIREILPSRRDSIEGFARAKGYEFYPWVDKTESGGGQGNQTYYYLTARKVRPTDEPDIPPPRQADIQYLPAVNISPSWWARWLFNRDYSALGWRKWLYIWTPLMWLLFLWLLGMLLWFVLSQQKSPITTQNVVSFFLLYGIVMYCRYVINKLIILMDDHIAVAPEHLIGMSEYGVCVELYKENFKDKSSPRVLRLVKYIAECPICAAEVLLDNGEPDFPRRIVGRCQESPREHVFSFDRVTKTGVGLRNY